MQTSTAVATRNFHRRAVARRALVRVDGKLHQAVIADVGQGGMRLERVELQVGDELKLFVQTSRSRTEPMLVLSAVVRWTVGQRAGVEFAHRDQRTMSAVGDIRQELA
ncbi:MAG: PilZ domain-containing protein [Deltaproteobacteria bacterium]|nr:PilZ domain-containing protein [Deltaproteobacteria bacterium]